MMSFWAFETEADWFAFNAEQMAVGEAVVAEHFVEATTSNWAGAFGNPTAEYAESVAGWNSIPHFDCAIRKVRQTKACASLSARPPARAVCQVAADRCLARSSWFNARSSKATSPTHRPATLTWRASGQHILL